MQLSLKRKWFSVVIAIALTAIALVVAGYKTFQQDSWRAIESESRNTLQAHARIGDWFAANSML